MTKDQANNEATLTENPMRSSNPIDFRRSTLGEKRATELITRQPLITPAVNAP